MKHFASLLFTVLCTCSLQAQGIKPDYIKKVPQAFKDCGALYAADQASLKQHKYIFVADFQNKALITINGKAIPLVLSESALTGNNTNVTLYTGGGYTVKLSVKTTGQHKGADTEAGSLQIMKGKMKQFVTIVGESSCDESKQEGNSR